MQSRGVGIGLVAGLAALSGCGTLPSGRRWGQDVTLTPGWERIRSAAWDNVTDPGTWLPIAAAGALQIDHLDERISDWAVENTPVFGSPDRAETASNSLREASYDLWLASILATPGGDSFGGWATSKVKGWATEVVAAAVGRGVTTVFKTTVSRERPDGSDDLSFPSGHMTEAWGHSVLGLRNLDSVDLPAPVTWTWRTAFYAAGLGTGWARVEAGKHYPGDVLFAAGATNFAVGFIHDAFMGLDTQPEITVEPGPSGGGWEVSLHWSH